MRTGEVACALVALSACALSHGAEAQDISSTVDSIDFRAPIKAQLPKPRKFEEPAQYNTELGDDRNILVTAMARPKKFNLTIDLPVFFAANPEHSRDGSADSAHLTPTGKFTFANTSGDFSYGASIYAIGDDFIGGAAKDTSILGGSLSGTYRDRTEKVSILASYAPKRVFSNTFGAGTVTLHDLTIGLGRTFSLGGVSLAVDLSYNRREASKAGFQQHQPTVVALLKGTFGRPYSWLLKQQIQRRIFSNAASLHRRDWNFSTLAEISRPIGSLLVAKLDLTFERNSSNMLVKSYSAFDIGPKLSIAYGF